MDVAIELSQAALVIGVGFLVWYVKRFISAQIDAYAKEMASIDARLAKLDELSGIERRLKEVAASVELTLRRTLDREALARSKQLDLLERQLSEFYWPLYFRLQTNTTIWTWLEQVAAAGSPQERQLAKTIDGTVIRENHKATVALITAKIHLAENDDDLERLLLAYVRHAVVYDAIWETNFPKGPTDVGEPYPRDLFDKVKQHVKERQSLYDKLIEEPLAAAESRTVPPAQTA